MKRTDIFKKFNDLRVLVIGDVMIDRYLTGKVERISPEAPVPIVNLLDAENRLGGAANVALNLKALGATPILCSVIGKDEEGAIFLRILQENELVADGIFQSEERRTTVKSRVIAGNQHLLRMDSEDSHDLSAKEAAKLWDGLQDLFKSQKIDVLLLQDYNKGVLTKSVIHIAMVMATQHNIPTIVDPKFSNFWSYQNVTLFKPNLKEVEAALQRKVMPDLENLKQASLEMRQKLKNKYSLITLSEKGVFVDDGEEAVIIPTHPRSIADVCGAGDTVVSVAALGLALGIDIQLIAKMANLAGGQVCEKIGVVTVDKVVLEMEMVVLKLE
ncbi:MAG: rfaE bifunctional protein kinase chain/domain [Paraglaciecola sp.]|jgi:rfaE bifunctional protein kinase chain/domain